MHHTVSKLRYGRTLPRLPETLENAGEHCLAGGIVAGAKERDLQLTKNGNFASVTGKEVTGTVEGHAIEVDRIHAPIGSVTLKENI